MASLDEKRRETIENLHDLTKQLDKVLVKTKNEKFQAYLKDLKEHAGYTTTNNQIITKKSLRKIYFLINKVNKELVHQVWNHWKIKKNIKKINMLLGIVLDY